MSDAGDGRQCHQCGGNTMISAGSKFTVDIREVAR